MSCIGLSLWEGCQSSQKRVFGEFYGACITEVWLNSIRYNTEVSEFNLHLFSLPWRSRSGTEFPPSNHKVGFLGREPAPILRLCVCVCVCVCVRELLNSVQLFVTPCMVACQAPLSMEISRQEYWSGLPFPSPGDFPDPQIELRSLVLQEDSLLPELPGKCLCY